jgi:hypothetical protein
MGSRRGAYRVLVGRPEAKRQFGKADVDERIILTSIFI